MVIMEIISMAMWLANGGSFRMKNPRGNYELVPKFERGNWRLKKLKFCCMFVLREMLRCVTLIEEMTFFITSGLKRDSNAK